MANDGIKYLYSRLSEIIAIGINAFHRDNIFQVPSSGERFNKSQRATQEVAAASSEGFCVVAIIYPSVVAKEAP